MSDPGRFLAGARRVGDQLCAQAVWNGELCNWIGHAMEEMDEQRFVIEPMVGALGVDLYAGSAGVALFLAELASRTEDPRHARAASAGARRSLEKLRASDVGFYSGSMGVAHAAGRVGALVGDEALLGRGLSLAAEVAASVVANPDLLPADDIISGRAGLILSLLGMRSIRGGSPLLAHAVRIGEQLLQLAAQEGALWWWPAPAAGLGPQEGAAPALTGYSHGAAGIGLALIELHAVTRNPVFLEAGVGAFLYEDQWFSPEHDNWPDLRAWSHPRGDGGSWGRTWCHGAPGIGLARARAIELVPALRERLGQDLLAAVRATRDGLKQLASTLSDATPCHGAAGLAELLLVAGPTLGDPGCAAEAARVGDALLQEWSERGSWKSGLPTGGFSPSLLLGTAGVGYFFLRLHDPERAPSILVSPHG